jgi:hypothetical protein
MSSKRLITPGSFNRWMAANAAEIDQEEQRNRAVFVDSLLRRVKLHLTSRGLQGACDWAWECQGRHGSSTLRPLAIDTLVEIGWIRPPGRGA